ncbi:hypothetical protein AXG93_2294s1360 [Marchantia polymorpha subsp. ruderalis]|uniref:Uncharacterized protein n=1 Tax=Marchantia polymorpha subsp. ruderalis TaxID=1480154 RepID=A0A176WEE4_MARPO|nr:hypothetical protein AXG93_2294s1360 [Marchantia polymorpha subsp. ruderalis]
MKIQRLSWTYEADLESLGLQLGIILNTSSVADLKISQRGLTARFFLNLASGLRKNSHSILKSLELMDWGDPNAVKFIVEVLNGYHQLETLSLLSSRYGGEGYVYDAAVRLLSLTLKQNSCLKELVLKGVEGRSAALLLYALAGDDGNRSIEQLELVRMSGIGKSLAEVFLSNRSLRVVTLKAITMPVEEWRLLGEAIRDNATATTVNIDTVLSRSYFNELKELSCAASSDGKEPLLHLGMDEDEDDMLAPFKLLSSVLRGEIKSVKSLTLLLMDFSLFSGTSIEDILPMNGITGETSRLERLNLTFGPGGFRCQSIRQRSRGVVQGPDGAVASEFNSQGNRCLRDPLGKERKGGAD